MFLHLPFFYAVDVYKSSLPCGDSGICSISTGNMFRGVLTFGAGIYAGIYLCQNYTIPRVDEPQILWQRVLDFMDKHKKSPGDK